MKYPENFSKNLKKALDSANEVTVQYGTKYVGSEHIIYGFLNLPDCVAYNVLIKNKVSPREYEKKFRLSIDRKTEMIGYTKRTVQMIQKAEYMGKILGVKPGTGHLLLAVLNTECMATKILESLGVDINKISADTRLYLDFLKKNTVNVEDVATGNDDYDNNPSGGGSNGNNSSSDDGYVEKIKEKDDFTDAKIFISEESENKVNLQDFGIELTERAAKGKIDPVIGRQKEIEKVVQVLSRRTKNNPVLIGEPGVGKSAIAEGLALLISQNKVPIQLINKKILSVDIAGMLAGTKYRGDFEEKLKNLINFVKEDGDIILFIDEIHTLIGAGGSADSPMDAANILKPMLARGELQVVGATTIEEYRKYIEKDSALERRLTPVYVEEPTEEDAIKILQGLKLKYEEHHGIKISNEAIKAAVKLSMRYINDRFLPDKAIDVIDEAAAHARIKTEETKEAIKNLEKHIERKISEKETYIERKDYEAARIALGEVDEMKRQLERYKNMILSDQDIDSKILDAEQVAAIISARTKIPLMRITQEEGEKLMHLEDDLHRRIVGQNEAVSAVAKAIRRARAGLKDPDRPIGSFIFVGPTGVGKTDLCKSLAEAMFGSEDQMIRLDMSEYMERQSISKLIGAAPGYAGYDDMQTGLLTDKVRSKPYCVILFDEIEKAHPDIFNLLLQILDDGRLTDNKGRTINFKNAVIILTSNIGAQETEKRTSYGFGSNFSNEDKNDEKQYDEMKERITEALKKHFRPEFLNRMDDIIVFHKLNKNDMLRIGEKMVRSLAMRLYEQRNIRLNITDRGLTQLVSECYDEQYGARPLKRAIQRRLEDKLSEEILTGRIENGQDIKVDYNGSEYVFSTI